jgi:hypothetical protein
LAKENQPREGFDLPRKHRSVVIPRKRSWKETQTIVDAYGTVLPNERVECQVPPVVQKVIARDQLWQLVYTSQLDPTDNDPLPE